MLRVIVFALAAGLLTFAVSAYLLNTIEQQNDQAGLTQACIELQRTIAEEVEEPELREQARTVGLNLGCPEAAMRPGAGPEAAVRPGAGDVGVVQIPAFLRYPLLNGIAAAVVALVIGLLVMIASNRRAQRDADRGLRDQYIMRERLRRHVGTRE